MNWLKPWFDNRTYTHERWRSFVTYVRITEQAAVGWSKPSRKKFSGCGDWDGQRRFSVRCRIFSEALSISFSSQSAELEWFLPRRETNSSVRKLSRKWACQKGQATLQQFLFLTQVAASCPGVSSYNYYKQRFVFVTTYHLRVSVSRPKCSSWEGSTFCPFHTNTEAILKSEPKQSQISISKRPLAKNKLCQVTEPTNNTVSGIKEESRGQLFIFLSKQGIQVAVRICMGKCFFSSRLRQRGDP